MPRGTSRGRGRGSYNQRGEPRESVHNRMDKVIYLKQNSNKKKYTYIKGQPLDASCIVSIPNENRIRTLAKRFVRSYYEIFDQVGRPNLESQYNPDAFFSFSATHPMPIIGRNLLEIREPDQRLTMLFYNKTTIAKQLATFPPTEHLVDHLTFDVPYFIANPMSITSMQIVITGVFKDNSETTNPLRAFTRVFVLKQTSVDKQSEPVYEIFNDIFMLQVPSPDQIKRYHQDTSASKKSLQQGRSNASLANTSSRLDPNEEKIKSVMSRTQLNRAASTQLLGEQNWDLEKAIDVFQQLHKLNKVPQSFFT